MAKRVTSRNTKAEILDAYSNLQEELKELRQEVRGAKNQTPSTSTTTAPAQTKTKKKEPLVMNNVEEVLSGLSVLRLGLGEAMSSLQQQLTTEAQTLQDILEQADKHTTDIQELHSLEINDSTLNQLLFEYMNTSTTFDSRMKSEREAFDGEMKELEAQWAQELEDHAKMIKERDDFVFTERQREEAEYRYDLTLSRKRDQDIYEQEQQKLQQELDDFETETRETLSQREDDLAQRETVYEELKVKVESFPGELQKSVDRAKREGEGIAKRQAQIKADLAAKEQEGKTRVFELRIQSLNATVDKQRDLIQDLSRQLGQAQRQAQELAVKAIEGASNANTFEAVRQIAMEQAKHPSKGK